jgi:WD40 repeat protein
MVTTKNDECFICDTFVLF